MKVNKP